MVVVVMAAIMFAGSEKPINASDTTALDITSTITVYDTIAGVRDTTAAVTNDATYGRYFSITQPTSITRKDVVYYLQNWTSEDGSIPAFIYKTVDSDKATIGFNVPSNNVTICANYTTDVPMVVQKNYLPDGSIGTSDPKTSGTGYVLPSSYYDGVSTYKSMTSVVYSDLFNDFTSGVINSEGAAGGSVYITGTGAIVDTSFTSNTNTPSHTIYEGATVSGQAPKEGSLVVYWVKAYNSSQMFDTYSMYYLDENGTQISCTDKSSANYVNVTKYKTLLVSGDTGTAYYVLVFKMPEHDVYLDFTYKDDETNNKIVTKTLSATSANTTLAATINSYGNIAMYNGVTLKGQICSSEIQSNRTKILSAKKALGDGAIFFVKSSDGQTISADGTHLYIAYDNDGDGVISSGELKSFSQKIQ